MMPDQPSPRRRFQFRLRTLMIGVTLLAVVCWALLSRVRLIEERDEARRDADNYKRLAEEWQAVISDDPASESATPGGANPEATAPHGSPQTNGVVPDGRTAIRIALAVWGPIYGDKEIEGGKPYVARLKNGIWTVEGSLPKDWYGGTAYIEINKADGKVLKVTHYK
jgi:hypothetical protein